MSINKLRISIVIPVYNEADSLAACLLAINRLRLAPHEVIVVDNNSTDGTAMVARSFAFVRLLREPKQGVVHARNRGFTAARGEIIGRIDADTIVDVNWTERVSQIMADTTVSAVSGSIEYYDVPHRQFFGQLELRFRQRIAKNMGDEVFLQGANMAIRRSAWLQVRENTCVNRGYHEDFDLAIHCHASGLRVVFDPSLHVGLSFRRIESSYTGFVTYLLQSPRTYKSHGRHAQRHMYPIITLATIMYYPVRFAYCGYDTQTDSFSLARLLAFSPNVRVNPASFTD